MTHSNAFDTSQPAKFERELAGLLNLYGIDNAVGIPDYVLARHLCVQVTALSTAVQQLRGHEGNAPAEPTDVS